jgi:type IV secretion system protein VirD4
VLRDSHAIILGKASGRLLGYSGPSNVWVCAPPRTRKTWGIVFPTLLTYSASVVINDLRGECYEMTAGFRGLERRLGGLGQRVLYYNPASMATHRHNPLDEIRLGVGEVKDTRNIVDMLIDPEATKDRRDHWDHAVAPLLTATILHLLYSRPAAFHTLEAAAYFLADAQRNIKESLEEMRTARYGTYGAHPVIASMAQELLQKSPNDLSGVVSTAMDYLGIYRDPLIAHLTKTSDFRIRDVQFGPVPVSLYLMIPPSDLAGTRPVFRVFLNQLTALLMEDHHAKGRREVLYVFDEFNALRKVDFLGERLAYMAGYKQRALIVNQSVPQLWDTWGRDEPITATCDVKALFTTNDRTTAQWCTDLSTKVTETRKQYGLSGERWRPFFQRRSTSEQEIERPILTPEAMLVLPLEKLAVFPMGHPRILADKLDFVHESWLQRRCLQPPPQVMPYDGPLALEAGPTVPEPPLPPITVRRPAPAAPAPTPRPARPPAPAVVDDDEEIDMRYVL